MFTVAFIAQRGGVGKTTLAYTLAVQAELAGANVVIVDADPMAAAWTWGQARKQNHGKDSPPVAAAATPELLRKALARARRERCDWVFIDTPAGVSELPATAASLADLLLIPCFPSKAIMKSMVSSVKLARMVRKPAFFVVNKGRSKAINDDCLAALVSAYGVPATNAHVPARMPIVDLGDEGLALPEVPGGESTLVKGRAEVRALWEWLLTQKETAHVAA
jgi:chromosome partitioning protein